MGDARRIEALIKLLGSDQEGEDTVQALKRALNAHGLTFHTLAEAFVQWVKKGAIRRALEDENFFRLPKEDQALLRQLTGWAFEVDEPLVNQALGQLRQWRREAQQHRQKRRQVINKLRRQRLDLTPWDELDGGDA
jgi:hypothetical protein